MRLKIKTLASSCDRTGVSDGAATLIANAVLQDLGLVTKNDTSCEAKLEDGNTPI
jgi:hypothetical protein